MKLNKKQEKAHKEYRAFMGNEKNIQNCEYCPEFREHSSRLGVLPCGQYNCWVELHCYPELLEVVM